MSNHLTGEAVARPEIRLRNGEMEAIITPQGGIISELWLNSSHGRDELLYPRKEIQTPGGPKTRGGSHVCLPLFGPSENLNQHGFGRDLPWEILGQSESTVSMILSVMGSEPVKCAELYAGLFAQLDYALKDGSSPGGPTLEMILIVENQGEEPMLVSPGFHPYFAAPEGWTVDDIVHDTTIGSFGKRGYSPKMYDKAELAAATAVGSEKGQVWMDTCNRAIEIKSDNLSHYVVWSGLEAPYICLEPTAGRSLDQSSNGDSALVPGEIKTFRSSITWHSV